MSRQYHQIVRCTVFMFVSTLALSAWSETWSDASGKFSIDAKYVGVEGKSIVLLKPNGTKISVPIAKLSGQSREQAKQLYRAEMKQLDEATAPSAGDTAMPAAVRPKRVLDFKPPIPPKPTASRAFPDGLSVEQTLDFVKKQLLDGHPEVLWDAIPKNMQATFDDPKLRNSLDPFMETQSQLSDSIEPLIFKAVQVLVTKKNFVLGSSMMAATPPDALPLIKQGYDPAVGVVYEIADLAFSVDLKSRSVSEMMKDHGPRIGSHLKQLLAMAPQGMVDGIFDSITIEQLDSDHAIISMPEQGSADGPGMGSVEMEDTKLVRVANRWVPEEFVSQWTELKAKADSGELSDEMKELKAASQEQSQGAMMFVGMMAGGAGTVLDGMLDAKTQEEFDVAIMQAASILPFGGPGMMEFGEMGPGEMHGDFDSPSGFQPIDDTPVEFTGEAPAGWTLDVAEMTIPEKPAKAIANGNAAKIAVASFQDGILELADSDSFGDKTSFVIFTFLNEGESIEGKKLKISPESGFGSPHIHFHFKTEGGSDSKIFMEKYAMRLEFGQIKDGVLPGEIYLCLPDAKRSIVLGKFRAKVEK